MQKLKYISAIDGLRALAVLAVLFYHLDIPLFKGGFMGVDIFFVLSGFLITRIIHTELLAGEFSFLRFYARRVRRIFPALFVMMFVASVAAILFLIPIEYRDYMRALRHAALQFSNVMFVERVSYFANAEAENPLLHTWSLGVEEQFYFIWPLLFWGVARFWQLKKVAWMLVPLSILSFAGSLYVLKIDPNKAFYLLPPRAWELAVGGMVALLATKPLHKKWLAEALGVAGVALMVWAILGFDNTDFPGVKALLPVFGAALAIYAFQAPHTTRIMKFFALKPIVFVGLISYSLYLWHWPLIAFYKNYTLLPLTWGVQAVIIVASFVLAVLSWRFVERPFRGHKAINYKKTFGIALVVMVSFVLMGNGLKEGYKQSWRYLGEFDKKIFEPEFIADTCGAQRQQHPKNWCVDNIKGTTYEVLFIGDSHVGHYTPVIQAWAKQKHYNVRYITRAACPVWLMSKNNTSVTDGKIATECAAYKEEFVKALQHKHLRYVVMALRTDAYVEANAMSQQFVNWRAEPIDNLDQSRTVFKQSVIDSWARIKQLAPKQTKLVFLGQVPMARDAATQCHLKNKLLGSRLVPNAPCIGFDKVYSDSRLSYGQKLFKDLTQDYNVLYFEPAQYITTFEDNQGNLIFRDSNHLNSYAANLLTEPFIKLVQQHGD